jgi:hypothetical protein
MNAGPKMRQNTRCRDFFRAGREMSGETWVALKNIYQKKTTTNKRGMVLFRAAFHRQKH